MTKQELIEELDRIESQIRELQSEHNVFSEMLADIEERNEPNSK
jgi:prefoldin subunit 5